MDSFDFFEKRLFLFVNNEKKSENETIVLITIVFERDEKKLVFPIDFENYAHPYLHLNTLLFLDNLFVCIL